MNLFADLPAPGRGEVFDEVLRRRGVRIERIVSSPEPEPTRYDQPWDEWVALLQGTATLDLAGESLTLVAGDCLLIPAHTPHRVLSTSAEPRCLWLAVHLHPG
jgi:cupin 2 domain-containing protein